MEKVRTPFVFALVLAAAFAMGSGAELYAQTSTSLWSNAVTPANIGWSDPSAVELGVKFQSSVNGYITALRFYKSPSNTGTHVGNLWTSTGTLLASVTFTNETASGWQQMALSSPVAITASTTYVASYHTNVGYYSVNAAYFASSGFANPPLTALGNSQSANGVYRYGSTSGFPNQSYNSCNYWVDVVFTTSLTADTTPPVVTAFTIPATATTLAVPISSFTATDNIGVTGYLVTESATAPLASATGWSGDSSHLLHIHVGRGQDPLRLGQGRCGQRVGKPERFCHHYPR